ncbi:MAG: glycosyltransferase family 1 protein [Treponema sp.]|nr:glycosyltransferase family 1 protein [Treponema sp.]
MRIAFVHYHLWPGGVSSVLYRQAGLLIDSDEVLIITGEAGGVLHDGVLHDGAIRGGPVHGGIPVAVVEALGYDRFRPAAGETPEEAAENLARGLLKAMKDHWGGPADVVHVHNPLIRKNTALLPALNILNCRGIRLLLQNHDLAEDFRPDVYYPGEYPENCHYAVINSRDYSFLHRAGLKPEGLHLIPNEVSALSPAASSMTASSMTASSPAPAAAARPPGRKRYLYPVRAIRRKNIGEALLLSLFIPQGKTVALTLPPTTQKDEAIYRRWIATAKELKLPVEFEIGASAPLAEIMAGAVCVITTSIKEGFGFSFLEPWLADRAVIGRRIDYVCRDFEEEGVRFESLYPEINIPMAYLSPPLVKHKIEHTLNAVYEAFGLETPEYFIKTMGDALLSRNTVDFGCLDEDLQKSIIRTLQSNRVVYQDIGDSNPFLGKLEDLSRDEALIEANKKAIQQAYGKDRIRTLLRETYRSVVDTPVTQRLSKSILLELYLDPGKIFMVGVGRD